jgi:hypothetical protein
VACGEVAKEEVIARQSSTIDFHVIFRATRSYTGDRNVEIVEIEHRYDGSKSWCEILRVLTSEALAKGLGISERHARRIKKGGITAEAELRQLNVMRR